MKKNVRFFCILFVMLLFLGIWTEKLFHYSFEKSILSAFQRIDYQPSKFTKRITIIDTSPIYDFTAHRTNRKALADVLSAIQLGQPQIIGLDIRLERDSLHQDCFGDSILKNTISKMEHIIIPQGIDPCFEITDPEKLANVQIHDGYEIPEMNAGMRTLSFQMASQINYHFNEQKKTFIINYQITQKDISETDQMILATDLLKILFDQSLTDIEKQDRTGLLLASQIVLVGFCNQAFDVDRHLTPLGEQPGIIIWANALHNILTSEIRIHYNPWWLILIWVIITAFATLILKNAHEKHSFFYGPIFILVTVALVVFWILFSIWLYFNFYIYLSIFSFSIISIIIFPLYLQLFRLGQLIKIIVVYPRIRYLPLSLKSAYLKFLIERNPFKKLHLSFTLIEECIKFSALLGLAQAKSLDVSLNQVIANQKWDRQKFCRLTFGEWQNILRSLINEFQNNPAFLETWKQIYLEMNESGIWKKNKLFKSIDDDFKVLEKIGDKETEINKQIQNLEYKPGWSARFSYYSLKWLNWRPFRGFLKFFMKDVSLLDKDVIKHRFGEVKQLIQLRNRLVHSGGVFMDNEEYQKIQPRFEIWLKSFLCDKFKFWQEVKLIQEMNQDIMELDLEIRGKKYRLTPFFLQATCSIHLKEELFLLSVIDIKKGRLIYEGKEQTCRLVIEDTVEKCEDIFNFLEINY